MTEQTQLMEAILLIKDVELQNIVTAALKEVPETFWLIPASSSGKYHPELSRGEGGLVRHRLATLYFAREYCQVYSATDHEQDCVIAALILHDIGKAMAEPHDIVGAQALRWIKSDHWLLENVIAGVRWHMGPWATGSTLCHKANAGLDVFLKTLVELNRLCTYLTMQPRVRG